MPETQEKTEAVKNYLIDHFEKNTREIRGFFVTNGTTTEKYDKDRKYADEYSLYEGWVRDRDDEVFVIFIRDVNEDLKPEEDSA